MKLAIWGAGAVGLGLAATLARPGEKILLVARDPETSQALRERGILRSGLFGERSVPPEQIEVAHDPAALLEQAPDWLLVCTKAFASESIARALEKLAPRLVGRSRLLLCQNGWGNEVPFLEFWPPERLFQARVITGFHRRRAHEVEVTAHAARVALGNVMGHDVSVLEPLAERFCAGGLPTETSNDLRRVLWAKMLYNCALNPLGALAGRRYGELTADPTTRRLVDDVIREIFRVLEAAGEPVAWPDATSYLTIFHDELIPPTAAHESSMLQDLRAGKPTEIESLCGAVERLGAEAGVETPIVSALAALVRAAERREAP